VRARAKAVVPAAVDARILTIRGEKLLLDAPRSTG
jgi:hypothetical protein